MPTWDSKKPTKKPVAKKVNTTNKKTDSKKEKKIVQELVIENNENNISANKEEVSTKNNSNWWLIIFLVLLWLAVALLLIALWNIKPGSSNLWDNFWFFKSKNSQSDNISSQSKDNSLSDWIVKNWDKIKVDYVWKLEDWTVFDSSIESEAKKAPDFKADSWRKFEPLEFSVWAWQMIKWFDAWVVWMKVWEKKTITIKPADAYWEATISQDVPKKYLSDNFEQEVPESSFRDYITQTVPKEALWEKWKNLKVGQELNEWQMTSTVEAITDSWVTLKIKNSENPFFGKKIVVWTKADYQWNVITIKKIGKDMITVNILNKQSPFFGKKMIVWLAWKLPNWDEIKIEKIWDENVTVSKKNPHKLAWKTLIFDVELKEIVK